MSFIARPLCLMLVVIAALAPRVALAADPVDDAAPVDAAPPVDASPPLEYIPPWQDPVTGEPLDSAQRPRTTSAPRSRENAPAGPSSSVMPLVEHRSAARQAADAADARRVFAMLASAAGAVVGGVLGTGMVFAYASVPPAAFIGFVSMPLLVAAGGVLAVAPFTDARGLAIVAGGALVTGGLVAGGTAAVAFSGKGTTTPGYESLVLSLRLGFITLSASAGAALGAAVTAPFVVVTDHE